VYVGSPLTYDVTVKNNGTATAGGVALTDNLPAGTVFDSATPGQGTCGESSGTVACQLGTLGPGESASVQIKVTPQQGGTITNTASVASNEQDASAADNTASEYTTVIARYARPKGASPFYASLVPAYRECTEPNSTHGASLSYGSCKPPAQVSNRLTVGTPDANRQAANSIGSVVLAVQPGDVKETVSITDVRNRGSLADYSGSLRETSSVRLTDRGNGPGDDQGTVADLDFGADVPCVATADPGVGSTCSLSTTFDALMPGAVVAGDRAIWQLGQVRLLDAFGDVFADQGVFVP
jgi:uncharacterized repeat protein (TIGR01451 family)